MVVCFTGVIAVATVLYTIVAGWQLYEIHSGAKDTHDLAVAAGKQADRMKDLADRMKDQTDRTKDLADRMKDQADQTRTIGTQAVVQANAAKEASDTAKKTLHVSERAYLILGVPVDDFLHKRTDIPIINSGHIPSGIAKAVIHEATFKIDDPSAKTVPFESVLERHWRTNTYQTIPVVPVGTLISLEVHFPALIKEDIDNGKQGIIIAVVVTYNDGFPNTPEQTFVFCDSSSYMVATKLFAMRPCDDSNAILQTLTALDKYPSPEYQEQ